MNDYFQTYGFEHMISINNLEKAGLLKVQGQKTYPTIRKSLKLIVDEVNEQVTIKSDCSSFLLCI